VTALLRTRDAGGGAPDAAMPVVYDRLRQIARRVLRGERRGHTLTPTALAHEAYLKLLGMHRIEWQNRDHFFATAVRTMRRVLVDYAVARRAQKRGGDRSPLVLRDSDAAANVRADDVLAVHEALDRLAAIAPTAVRIVECRVFLGLTIEETASSLDLSPATVKRHWTMARAWLTRELTGDRSRG
jgi:RNA polymerase sigma factor (TIGR02999 family)